jgi:DNA transposition AAA+ family ATPase
MRANTKKIQTKKKSFAQSKPSDLMITPAEETQSERELRELRAYQNKRVYEEVLKDWNREQERLQNIRETAEARKGSEQIRTYAVLKSK